MINVLFVCIHNSARSQMAEAFLNKYGQDKFVAESAGIEKGQLNPLVVASMQEEGIDISGNRTKDVTEILNNGKLYDVVITVCDAASAERCPIFPGGAKRIAWWFDDPSALSGNDEEKLRKIRLIREQIKNSILHFLDATN